MDQISVSEMITFAIQGLMTLGALSIANSMADMRKSIERLNEKIAVVLERTSLHKEQIDDHSTRLRELESKINH